MSFNLINKLYFERVTGTEKEAKAAEIIKQECENLGVKTEIENFTFDSYEIDTAELSFDECPIKCVGVGMTGSTNGKIEKPFIYIASKEEAEMLDVEDKICLIHGKYINKTIYKILADKNVAGIISCTGNVYNSAEETDLNPLMMKATRGYKDIPIVCISMSDAERLVKIEPEKIAMNLIQRVVPKTSNNVVAKIQGESDEEIVFTAHLDTVPFSKGAYDNASGCATIMKIAEHFSKTKPQKTLTFVWCGCEEFDMGGSQYYVENHEQEIKNTKLCVNVDMAGLALGYDCAVVTANKEMEDYIKELSNKAKFPISANLRVYSSDCVPFAQMGIPAVSFARFSWSGGVEFHSRKDVIERLSETKFNNTSSFIIKFIEEILKDDKILNETCVCEDIKKQIEDYAKF